jgi:hypothetical protein
MSTVISEQAAEAGLDTSAADLKSLHHLLQTRVRDFKSISGTRII